ncbi:adenylate/guanylate cyclase domain-containing response regulator [Oceanicoccus sp. KOV_DT_Chl]|uniref:adenylate/guanylate cyclase domain-containing response regulator n=1 Tax=Oceanicoccus sp. KOV_DT_Chl TaxID=1904639 RepID=UPI001F2CEBE1|nr:adenylate/guanylate cyclase domain-containing response regulator [Oceanicoccus sp. KOV_DT_Chl]
MVYSQQLLELGENPSQESTNSQQIIAAGTSGTILIVDDQQESREILRRYLQQSKHKVVEAAGGREMFECLKTEVIDLILLDLILPEMDGDELLQQLKQDDVLRAIPVIVVSGNKDTARVIRCIEAGAEDYLFKPFNPALLHARISAGVDRKLWHDKEKLYREELERNQTFIRKVFGRYLSEEIVSKLLEDPDGLEMGGEQRKVSVLMADIRGFTTIAEQLSPQRVVRLLNNYLGTMSEIIMKYNGTVDEFIGDAILAIFGAPISRENDTDRAISCAIEMQTAISAINQRNRAENLPEISMGISINTGLVVAGNIGSEKRTKYGVVGHAVNQTARIEEHCGAGNILISEATLKDCQATLRTGESKTIQAKGILQSIKIYELLGIESPSANTDDYPTSTPTSDING